MDKLTKQLQYYRAYHQNRRNIATHLIGIPLIILSLQVLLSKPTLYTTMAVDITPATITSLLLCAYYLYLNLRLGMVMLVWLIASLAVAVQIAGIASSLWLFAGGGLFIAGWLLQFLGHWFEGRKPAFMDDLRGLVIGPLFVADEYLRIFSAGTQHPDR